MYDRMRGVTPPYAHNPAEVLAIPNGYFNYDMMPNVSFWYDAKKLRKVSIDTYIKYSVYRIFPVF